MYSELKELVTNLKPYWKFVNCARRTLRIGEWEGAYDNAENGSRDPVLKEFRNLGLELVGHGINLKIYPRFKAFMVDYPARDQSKSAFLWHGVKNPKNVLDFWIAQNNDTIFPKCATKEGSSPFR